MDGILASFYSQIFCRLLFLILVLWFGEPWASLLLRESSAAEISLLLLNYNTWVWGQPILHFHSY